MLNLKLRIYVASEKESIQLQNNCLIMCDNTLKALDLSSIVRVNKTHFSTKEKFYEYDFDLKNQKKIENTTIESLCKCMVDTLALMILELKNTIHKNIYLPNEVCCIFETPNKLDNISEFEAFMNLNEITLDEARVIYEKNKVLIQSIFDNKDPKDFGCESPSFFKECNLSKRLDEERKQSLLKLLNDLYPGQWEIIEFKKPLHQQPNKSNLTGYTYEGHLENLGIRSLEIDKIKHDILLKIELEILKKNVNVAQYEVHNLVIEKIVIYNLEDFLNSEKIAELVHKKEPEGFLNPEEISKSTQQLNY